MRVGINENVCMVVVMLMMSALHATAYCVNGTSGADRNSGTSSSCQENNPGGGKQCG